MQPVGNQPRQMTPRPQIQSPGPHFSNVGGQFPPRMLQNQFQGTPQFRGDYTEIIKILIKFTFFIHLFF